LTLLSAIKNFTTDDISANDEASNIVYAVYIEIFHEEKFRAKALAQMNSLRATLRAVTCVNSSSRAVMAACPVREILVNGVVQLNLSNMTIQLVKIGSADTNTYVISLKTNSYHSINVVNGY
jgi:hypothetical protein